MYKVSSENESTYDEKYIFMMVGLSPMRVSRVVPPPMQIKFDL